MDDFWHCFHIMLWDMSEQNWFSQVPKHLFNVKIRGNLYQFFLFPHLFPFDFIFSLLL